ncbi:MAG: hypothetical protein KGJ07_00595 [Patescibacteria group bacterium]|nr:hypothetical protein [Patescibacteria group bacterium]
MSIEGAIRLIDNSAKDSDETIYKMNLLARTLKSNKYMPEFLDELMDFYGWMQSQHPEMIAKVWMPKFKSFVVAVEATSSESGWLMDIITQVRVSYKGNNPEARKMSLMKADKQAEQSNMS